MRHIKFTGDLPDAWISWLPTRLAPLPKDPILHEARLYLGTRLVLSVTPRGYPHSRYLPEGHYALDEEQLAELLLLAEGGGDGLTDWLVAQVIRSEGAR